MALDSPDVADLLDRARRGETGCVETLFERHRARLHAAIRLRLDRRLAARCDASDVVQETYLEAARRFSSYLAESKMPFYLWLRWIASDKVIALYRKHLGTEKRRLDLEVTYLPTDTSTDLIMSMLAPERTASQKLANAELVEYLHEALGALDTEDRDLILWRHFEQLSNAESAHLLEITPAAASKRYIRALERLRKWLIRRGVSHP